MEIYVVKRGDTAREIASRYGISEESLLEDNQIASGAGLVVGQALLINNGPANRDRIIRSAGYAYPGINDVVFADTLPFLSSLYVFSYRFDAQGSLIVPRQNVNNMILPALEQGVVSVLTLTPTAQDGSFDSDLISTLLGDYDAQDVLLDQIIIEMNEKGFVALNLDFEYIKAEDAEAYVEFVEECAKMMHENGFQLSVALAPKTSANQQGLLYEGMDYRELGRAADLVILMTYEWGYIEGPPMAVAPIDKVRQVLSYAVSEISPDKIMLGIPNYGYDWPLPYEAGVTRANTIGNVEAVQIAAANSVEIAFNETSASPYFLYLRDGIRHEVWFEDVRSYQAKYDLVKEFGIHGVCFWQLMRFFRAGWLLLEDNFFRIPGL